MPKRIACPTCGSTNVAQVEAREERPLPGDYDKRPLSVYYTYKCQCGMAFTSTLKHEHLRADAPGADRLGN